MSRFTKMAYATSDDMTFGRSKKPLSYGLGIKVGLGSVIPEINYLPRPGAESSRERLVKEYVQYITQDCIKQAVNLGFPNLQLETEWIHTMSDDLGLAASVVSGQKEAITNFHEKYGINLAVRHTVPDLRDASYGLRAGMDTNGRPEKVIECAEVACENGADVLSIESLGGKELSDYAVTTGDITAFLFGAGFLASKDMESLWKELSGICKKHRVIPGGDSNCACSNTVMFMAGGHLDKDVQKTFSAVCRCISAASVLVVFENGAVGPGKDCSYEGPIVKSITGMPISSEGKHSHCAHMDLFGNLTAAVTDMWSNESVQYRHEFGGTSVQCWAGLIGYECSLMNTAISTGTEKTLRDLYTLSDRGRSPEGYILSYDNAWKIGKSIIECGNSHYLRARTAGITGAKLLIDGYNNKDIGLSRKQLETLYKIIRDLESLPDDEDVFLDMCIRKYADVRGFNIKNYGI